MLRREHGIKEVNCTRCCSELTAKEYAEVSAEMSKGFGRTPKRKMTKPKEQGNEDSKRLRAATQNRATAIRKCKTFIDKCAGDASSCEADLSKPKLQTYPEAMTSWFLQRIQEFQAVIREAQQGYAAETTRKGTVQSTAHKARNAVSGSGRAERRYHRCDAHSCEAPERAEESASVLAGYGNPGGAGFIFGQTTLRVFMRTIRVLAGIDGGSGKASQQLLR